MDYDDNDFHSQNFHLAGEGSTKFPPVLRPYALPKFDFDDNHLRFDSLVETEVFLGIESNQDNHWIEDFSRGSSGIEFNSSAAESCSISRRNNVWSEATSSESVEMLLKSVGQEEINAAPTIIEESDACDELGCLTKQMEHSLKHDGSVLSTAEDVTNLQSALPPDEVVGNSSGLKGDVGVDQPYVEDAAQNQGSESFVHGGSHDHDPNVDGEKVGLHVTEGDIFVDIKSDDANKMDVDEHLDVQRQEDSFASRVQTVNLASSVQNTSTSSTELNNDVQPRMNVVQDENPDGNVLSKKAKMDSQNADGNRMDGTLHDENPLLSASQVETVAEDVIEADKSNVEEPSSEMQKGHYEVPTVAGLSKHECSGVPVEASKCEDMVLCKDTGIDGGRPEINMLDIPQETLKSDAQSERCVVEARNISSEILSDLKAKMDYVESSGKEDVVESRQQLDSEILARNSETSLPSIEVSKISEGVDLERSKSHTGGISNLNVTRSSPELSSETNVTGDLRGVHDALGSSGENLSAESLVPPTILTESTQIFERDKSYVQAGVYPCQHDVSVSEKENTKLSNDRSNTDSASLDKDVGPSFDERTESELNISTLGVTAAGNESASDVALPNSNLASHEKSDEVSLPSQNGAKIATDQRDSQISPVSVAGLTPLEEKDDAATKILADSIVPSSIVSSQVQAASEAEEAAPCDNTVELLGKTVDQSVTISEEHAKEVDISPVLRECTVSDVDATEVVALPETHKKATVEKHVLKDVADTSEPTTNKDEVLTQVEPVTLVEAIDITCHKVEDGHKATIVSEDKSSGKTSEPDTKNNGGSSDHSIPTPSSPKHSQGVHGEEEGVKGSTDQNSSVSKVVEGDAGKIASSKRGPKRMDAPKEGKNGSFDVRSSAELSKRGAVKNLPSFSASPAARIAEGSPSSSLVGQSDPKNAQDIPQATLQVSDVEIPRGRPKGTSERKSRRSSVKAAGKDNAKKGSNLKEVTPAKQAERGEKAINVSPAPSGIFHVVQSNEMQHYGNIEGNNHNKPFFVLAASTSSLPDLNTSASPSAIFQQPFTDFQQVQLRAQIFVYGALIQGTAPEEAYMLSAFGGSDGGRSLWGNAWQACVERLQSQKSTPINPETPLHQRHTSAGARNLDLVGKQSTLQIQSKGLSTPVGRSSTKGSQTIVSPMIPLSSPLWSITTPVGDGMQSGTMPRSSVMDYPQALTPVHPFQTPSIRNLLGHNTSWMSQPSFRGPWVASPQPSVPEASTRFTAFPNTEPVQLIPVKETTVPHSSATKHVSSSPMIQTGAPASVFAAAPMLDLKKVTSSPGQHSADTKTRKRKKNQVSEESGPVIFQSQSKPEAVLAPAISSGLSTSVAITNPASFVSQATSEKVLVSATPAPPSDALRKAEHHVMQKAILSEETLSKIKEASKEAEDAASLAAAAVGRCQELWNQLEQQKNSGLVPDVEAKLASAAAAIAAAAAVAKAAAAAANVASNAALQAKMMADEAFISNSFENPSLSNRISFSERVSVLGKATPASILRGEDGANSSSSIITAAREAARRKVEAASAASKRAENMDAIVKAAELAAEAISQAGKIVAMGDAMPLNDLIEAGPQGYWRAPQVSSEQVAKSIEITREQSKVGGVGEGANYSTKNSKDGRSGKKDTQTTVNEKSFISRKVTKESVEEHLKPGDGISGSVVTGEKETRGQRGHKVSDLTKNIAVFLEPETTSKSSSINVENEVEKTGEALKANSIKEGSKVEVFKDGSGFKAAWYMANVLSLNDGRACVSYTETEQDEGLAQLREWVALDGEGDDRPKIRIARSVTAMRYEGTRKRRRAAMGDYNWSVGDRVDAWMTNSWWEGVVTEKNKKDETSLTVHFPAQGETTLVKAWHLRPSLIWKDGEWVEWSNLRNDSSSHEGDIPQEKRLKLGSPAIEAKGKDKTEKSTDNLDAGKLEESRLLDLAPNEKAFNIGKSTRNANKPDTTRMVRTGLQKQGSGVIFGVPKPGKKRKFMEVSKYNVADQSNKNNESNDSLKFLKYMTPQGPGSRGLKNDPKEKRVAESKLKGLKAGKQPSVSGRTVPQRENFSANPITSSGDSTIGDHVGKAKDSLSHVDNTSGKQNLMETVPFSGSMGATEGSFVFSSLAPTLDGPSKKISSSTAKPERANKGKLAPASGKLGKIEENKVFNGNTAKSTSEVVEPRRSNRRIQPTSRLLEGLQSSLIIPKFPSVSHDKGYRSQYKNTSRGNNHG